MSGEDRDTWSDRHFWWLLIPAPVIVAIVHAVRDQLDRGHDLRCIDDLPRLALSHRLVSARIDEAGRAPTRTQSSQALNRRVNTGLMGVFHGVSRQWLQSYLNEYVFRYNHREGIDPFKVLVALSARPVSG